MLSRVSTFTKPPPLCDSRTMRWIVVLAAVGGCNALFGVGDLRYDAASDGGGGSGSSGGATSSTTSSAGGVGGLGGMAGIGGGGGVGGFLCGQAIIGSSAQCPPECTSCVPGICLIDCGTSDCQDANIVCPADFACHVACGDHGCDQVTVQCPDKFECSLQCVDKDACKGVQLGCSSTGVCSVSCGAQVGACGDVQVTCGQNACGATCTGGTSPTFDCGASCQCTPC
jgi:hypothetical protein